SSGFTYLSLAVAPATWYNRFNSILFPNDIEVFRWNDDFSDYFDAGKEWWGTGLWSAYDEITKEITVIGASLTD
ncbi:MAG: hypothetical protein Q4B85_14065, partial [Lachnospiraceae bacterium]|nr:hypothetical protein [Lachnospiraceae bacterium]